jgi:hypothetical protein
MQKIFTIYDIRFTITEESRRDAFGRISKTLHLIAYSLIAYSLIAYSLIAYSLIAYSLQPNSLQPAACSLTSKSSKLRNLSSEIEYKS